MFELPLAKAEVKKVKDHQYYVFPKPATHKNQDGRPKAYANVNDLVTYRGSGSNGSAKMLPSLVTIADLLMSALLEYGEHIDDWSMRSAVIHNGYRPDDASQGRMYLSVIKHTIATNSVFSKVEFPANLEEEAQSVLGDAGDPRLRKFMNDVATSPGWDQKLADTLFSIVHNRYAPRGFNPHSTGLVFDLDFWIFNTLITSRDTEVQLGANADINSVALQSAAGMWINMYAMAFCFDSYDTDQEVFHLEYRNCPGPSAGKRVPFYDP